MTGWNYEIPDTSEARLARVAEICGSFRGRRDEGAAGEEPTERAVRHIEEMRRWIKAGGKSWDLPVVRDVRDYLGFPVADEYEALLVQEADVRGDSADLIT